MSSLTLKSRLLIAFVAVIVGFIAIGMTALFDLKKVMEQDRRAEIRSVTESAKATVEYFQKLQAQGALSEEEAKKQAIAALRPLRFNGGNYVFILNTEYNYVLSPGKPEVEGKSGKDTKDSTGRYFMSDLVDVARNQAEGGYVDYEWPKTAGGANVAKVSYANLFAPWGWVLGAGVYLDDVSAAFWSQAWRMLALAIPIVIVIVLIFLFVARSILKQLGGEPTYAVSVVQTIARGDLSQSIDLGAAQADSMLAAVANMRDGLVSMMKKMVTVADSLTSHAHHIATAATQVATASHEQAQATITSAAALEQVTVSINEVSEIAVATEERAADTLSKATHGQAAVEKAAAEVQEVERLISASATKVEELKNRSIEIGSVANVIKEIADQTNLLALNAAIEAARAGEQGRGFAVVADEVRKLAERTSEATTRIATTVQSVQVETDGVVHTMQETVPQVQASMAQVHEVADILGEIRREADDSVAKARDVAQATREQGTAANDIAANVEHIASMAEEVSATMTGNAGAAEEMQQLAHELQAAVGQFKLP
ncbi:methyl-accepting chemotaxis protein [Azonexus sp. IMCC34839]|uniref:methyl-accepting chemotaxis protein n=1 Tax=Azonexus sp. IMCC34839 TaxID=3133695 RepID=UPI003999DD49